MTAHGKTILKLVVLVVGMFGFAFALVPIYDLICEVTGLGGRTDGKTEVAVDELRVDSSRLVTVRFVTNTNEGMPWAFQSEKQAMRVHPGETHSAEFVIENLSNRGIHGQAIPSLVPILATDYFHKTECFCFTQQYLAAGETMRMPLVFTVDPELPEHVRSVTLSYAYFEVPQVEGNPLTS